MYQFIGTKEYEIQNYDFGCVFPDFCLLWKDGKKISNKFIKQFLKMQEDIERIENQEKNATRCVNGETPTPPDNIPKRKEKKLNAQNRRKVVNK